MENSKLFWNVGHRDFIKTIEEACFKCPKILKMYLSSNGADLTTPNNLMYFKEPNRNAYPLDLNKGFENYKFHDVENFFKCTLNKIEKFIMDTDFLYQLEDEAGAASVDMSRVFTQRSVLVPIMMTPYRNGNPGHNNWTVRAIHFKDILYLVLKKKYEIRASVTDTYHYKFEQYCFAESASQQPDTEKPIDENIRCHSIFQSQLKEFNILYSSEISGIKADEDVNVSDLDNIEQLNDLKLVITKLMWMTSYPWKKHFRAMQFWAQAYLTKCYDLCIGLKDVDGYVRGPVQHITCNDISKGQFWNPLICIGFLYKFLSMVKSKMNAIDCPYTVYEFQFESDKKLINYSVHEGKTEHSFLSEEFIKHINKVTSTVE